MTESKLTDEEYIGNFYFVNHLSLNIYYLRSNIKKIPSS